MYNTTNRRRYSARAAAIAATAAIIFGAAACGTETADDNGNPAAPAAPAPKAKAGHSATSADAAERRAYADRQEEYRRHLEGAAAAQSLKVRRAPGGHWREIPST